MNGNYFVDTNILVYFFDSSDMKKQTKSSEWLRCLWRKKTGRISIQVIEELYVTLTRKLDPGLSKKKAESYISTLFAWNPQPLDISVITNAWRIEKRYKFSFWDSMILSAAQKSMCDFILSEDLQDGQIVDEIRVINPFVHDPAAAG